MTDTAAAPTPAPLGLIPRIIGVITAPRATFENIVAVPRPAGVLFIVAAVIALVSVAPQFTETGRLATLDAQVKMAERFGATITPEAYAAMETRSQNVPLRLLGGVSAFIFLPVVSLLFAALYWAVFNTVLGGTASYKQALAIVTHSQVIGALGAVIGLPIQLMTGVVTMTGPFNLGALAPMLEEGSTLANFLGAISVFSLWGFIVTGVGLGVLYRRSARNIAIGIIAVYLLIMYGAISFFGSFMGRAS